MRPIQGSYDPYRRYLPPPRRELVPIEGIGSTGSVALRRVPADASSAPGSSGSRGGQADMELSVRVLADGGSITVKRHTVADASGARRTVGIDAMVR